MSATAHSIDGVFRALADPTRRQVLARRSKSPASVSELAEPFAQGAQALVELVELELYLAWRDRGMKVEAPAVRP
jgi:hypothetical protein